MYRPRRNEFSFTNIPDMFCGVTMCVKHNVGAQQISDLLVGSESPLPELHRSKTHKQMSCDNLTVITCHTRQNATGMDGNT